MILASSRTNRSLLEDFHKYGTVIGCHSNYPSKQHPAMAEQELVATWTKSHTSGSLTDFHSASFFIDENGALGYKTVKPEA
ncbi:hypothetical protein R1flu_006745 [Riccia fluitans]|uniref:Alkyl hydroperoxide reductase subunit C/ Thiol specific antioxidant domain-containing protein n=1 Tax=Riccia fluitans TaxID=41844 RepID=A0ABD1YWW4_9MARC